MQIIKKTAFEIAPLGVWCGECDHLEIDRRDVLEYRCLIWEKKLKGKGAPWYPIHEVKRCSECLDATGDSQRK